MSESITRNCADLAAVVMAAGKGTRMKSDTAKVLHPIMGRPMIRYVLDTLQEVQASPQVIVIGHAAESVREACGEAYAYALQQEQHGTGHAVQTALPELAGFAGDVLIVSGDMPLVPASVWQALVSLHRAEGNDFTILTANSAAHRDFGRIVRQPDGQVAKIVEAKDCSPEEYALTEVNLGAYCAKADFLRTMLPLLSSDNAQGELYLTDLVSLGQQHSKRVGAMLTEDIACALGVNSRADLAQATAVIKARILRTLMLSGVTVLDPVTTWIEPTVKIGCNTVILPGTMLQGTTSIGCSCQIGPNTQITDSSLGDSCSVSHSVLWQAEVGRAAKIGPFAYLRPGTQLRDSVKVGDFVEIKNSIIDDGTKIPHLTYVGDSDVGSHTNIGCGTITCNYDGQHKHRTVIGDNVFIGSNTSLIAPVNIGDGAKTGAGAVITKDVAPGSVVVGVPAHPLSEKH
ncbi:MAG: bifunctional UDP-N-acetylglucosamine diphosphorylase/glucosamine-1-phosphate N-acetyltransferase GlmU [bacterium]|nr:bifunctional UDP-N-acetylglucosamine diphosphorylase/glucosamine-1-phosphate N-acetyltransferase GlmU [bacterium]